jgi:NitT/TauT family transport system substrate-binding protein
MRRAAAVVLAAVLAAAAAVVAVLVFSSPAKRGPVVLPTPAVLRLGYVTQLADGPALAGLAMGFMGPSGAGVSVQPVPFASASAEAQALYRGQLDGAYLDPVLAVAVWQAEGDGGIKIVAGSASGGAELVARSGVTSPSQLGRERVAAPAGTASEAALTWWLRQNGVSADGPGDVTMTGAYLAEAIKGGKLAAAWEPAPLDAEMTAAGGRVLVNEASLWPGGQFSSAVLVVSSRFLAAHPGAVTALLRAHLQALQYLQTDASHADTAVARQLKAAGDPGMPAAVLAAGFAQVSFTDNPLAGTVFAEAQHAAAAGMLRPVPSTAAMASLFDLGPLDVLLKAARLPQVPT